MHTTRCFTWSEIVHVHHTKKLLMEKVVSAFWGKNDTNYFVAIKTDFVFSSIVTTTLVHKKWKC